MFATVAGKEEVGVKARPLGGLFRQLALVSTSGLVVAGVMLAQLTSLAVLDRVALWFAAGAMLVSLVAVLLPLAIGRSSSDAAGSVVHRDGLYWRAAWVCLVLGAVSLFVPIGSLLLTTFAIGKAVFASAVFFMAVGGFLAYQLEQAREAGRAD